MIATKEKVLAKFNKETIDQILYYTQSLIYSEKEQKKEKALLEIRKALRNEELYLT